MNKLPFGRSGGGRFNGAAAAVAAAGRLAAAGLDRRPYFKKILQSDEPKRGRDNPQKNDWKEEI